VVTEPADAEVAAWLDAAARPEVEIAISEVHAMIESAVHASRPHCLASGRCCRFEEFGHRLYATGLEAARCVRLCNAEGRPIDALAVDAAVQRGNCPWQEGRLCLARHGRPVGCRVYFCDPLMHDLVPELAEEAHTRIKSIHERFDVPYAYGEWRGLLRRVVGG
jgi:hypothetical protein